MRLDRETGKERERERERAIEHLEGRPLFPLDPSRTRRGFTLVKQQNITQHGGTTRRSFTPPTKMKWPQWPRHARHDVVFAIVEFRHAASAAFVLPFAAAFTPPLPIPSYAVISSPPHVASTSTPVSSSTFDSSSSAACPSLCAIMAVLITKVLHKKLASFRKNEGWVGGGEGDVGSRTERDKKRSCTQHRLAYCSMDRSGRNASVLQIR